MYFPRTGHGLGASDCLGPAIGSTSSHVFSVTSSNVRQRNTSPSGVPLVLSLQRRVREMSSWSSKAQPETNFLHPHHVPPTHTLTCAALHSPFPQLRSASPPEASPFPRIILPFNSQPRHAFSCVQIKISELF